MWGCGAVRGDVGRYMGMWGGTWGCGAGHGVVGRYVGVWGGTWRCGAVRGDVGRYVGVPQGFSTVFHQQPRALMPPTMDLS